MLANQAIQFQEVQKIYFLEARSLLRPCYHVHINVAVWSFANMAMPKTDALQASWDISWQGIRRTVRTSQSHAPPEEQSWTKANRKHTGNSLTPRTPGICLGNERGLVRELDTTMNNGRPQKDCVSCRIILAACCRKLPLGHWRLPRATVSCHHLSTCQVDTTRCTEQYRTWHTDNLGRTDKPRVPCRMLCQCWPRSFYCDDVLWQLPSRLHCCSLKVDSDLSEVLKKKLHPPASASKSAREAHSFRATAFKSANTARIPSI